MNRTSATAWARARTLEDLAALNVRWLGGGLRHPGYGRPDPETVPLAAVLQALNHAGLVTSSSQPGRGADTGWEQRAYVAGFAGPGAALALTLLARTAGLTAVTYAPDRLPAADQDSKAVQVSRRTIPLDHPDAAGQTIAAVQLSRDTITTEWEGISGDAAGALCGAWQVTLIDPEWGRPLHLFNVLAVWAASVLPAPVLLPALPES
jgi:hypothetical protein